MNILEIQKELEDSKKIAQAELRRVASISKLLIEIDFLFGSRQQELQRSGRLMHSEEAERHDILMTEAEFKQYGKRIWALQEKGFSIKVVS